MHRLSNRGSGIYSNRTTGSYTSKLWCLIFASVLWFVSVTALAGGIDRDVNATAATIWTEADIPRGQADAIWLAGFAATGNDPESSLSLVWYQDGGPWFSVWKLQLHGDPGVLAAADSGVIDLRVTNAPRAGEVYQAAMSYDSLSGQLSLLVRNATSGERLYAGNMQVGASSSALAPGQPGHPGSVSITRFDEGFVPVGGDWDLYTETAGQYVRAAYVNRDEVQFVGIHAGEGTGSGRYRFSLETAAGRTELLNIPSGAPSGMYPIVTQPEPHGEHTLVMEYLLHDTVVMSERRPITVGDVLFRFAATDIDRASGTLSGTYWVSADGPIPPVNISLSAQWVEQVWDGSKQRYSAGRKQLADLVYDQVSVTTNAAEIPFAVPMPADDNPSSVWFLTITPTVSEPVYLTVSGASWVLPPPDDAGTKLNVMSFNVRAPLPDDGPNAWVYRKDLLTQVIRERDPDVLGVQEPFTLQLIAIDHDLPEYKRIAIPSYGGASSHNAIYYHTGRLELLDWGVFWYNAERNQPSRLATGGAARSMIWGQFRQRATGQTFYVYNTHLRAGAEPEAARERSDAARIIAEHIRKHGPDARAIVLGDLNSTPGSEVHRILTSAQSAPLADVWTTAASTEGPEGTYHGFTGVVKSRIDYIMYRGAVQPIVMEQSIAHEGSMYPSDHLPITATFLLW